jgi:hypothetical protein
VKLLVYTEKEAQLSIVIYITIWKDGHSVASSDLIFEHREGTEHQKVQMNFW